MYHFIGNQFRKPSGLLGKVVSLLMQKGNRAAYDLLIPALDIKPGDKIFEIGYGHGLGVEFVLSHYSCSMSGVDFSKTMFKEASRRNRKFIEEKKAELHYGDFLNYDMQKGAFDKIFCINVTYFWENLDIPFSKIMEGLKKGGLFCICMAHPDDLEKLKFAKKGIFNKHSIEHVTEKLKDIGFVDISYTFDKRYIVKCARR